MIEKRGILYKNFRTGDVNIVPRRSTCFTGRRAKKVLKRGTSRVKGDVWSPQAYQSIFLYRSKNVNVTLRPTFKKPILDLRIEFKLRIAGVPTEHLFSLHAWFKKTEMFGWHRCYSEFGFNPQAQDWFFEYGSRWFSQLKF